MNAEERIGRLKLFKAKLVEWDKTRDGNLREWLNHNVEAVQRDVVEAGCFYYGVAGNLRSLVKVYRVVARYWRRMLCGRSWAGRRLTWDAFNQIKERTPLLKPKLRLPYGKLQALAVL